MKRLKALLKLRDELKEFYDEFDVSDPEWTQILFHKRVSALIRSGTIKTSKLPRKVGLTDVFELLFGEANAAENYAEVLENTQKFDGILSSYSGEPSEEEMEEAQELLTGIIDKLSESLEKEHEREQH